MRIKIRSEKALYSIVVRLMAFVLLFSIIVPSIAVADVAIPELTITPEIKEVDLKSSSGNTAIELTLTGAEWVADEDLTPEKKFLLIDSLKVTEQNDQWGLIKKELMKNIDGYIARGEDTTSDIGVKNSKVIITIPTVEKLSLTQDLIISVNVPYQLLLDTVNVPNRTFTIQAQPKVLLSGTAIPEISQTDFNKGGKTIVLTLLNTTWISNIASNTVKRNKLLSAFELDDAIENEVKARADVQLTNNETTILITLPAISNKFSGEIVFDSSKLVDPKLLKDITEFEKKTELIKVTPVTDQTFVVSGTSTNKINTLDIIKGGKTVIITLKNDIWKQDIVSENILLSSERKIKLTTAGDKEIGYSIQRVNDTTAILTLEPEVQFPTETNENVKITIPNELLSIRTGEKDLIKENAFSINAVTATMTGTGTSLDSIDIKKGGKTLIFTLDHAEFKADLKIDDVKRIFTCGDSTLHNPFCDISSENFTVAKNKLSIKLPAFPLYPSSAAPDINIAINSKVLSGYEEAEDKTGDFIFNSSIKMGETASAKFSDESLSLKANDLQSKTFAIVIELENTKWDKTIQTNSSKRSALVRGFSPDNQTKEWGRISSALIKEGDFKVSESDDKILTITLNGGVPDYSILQKQIVNLSVSKSVLENYKYDIKLKNSITISAPSLEGTTEQFSKILGDGLAIYIEKNGLNTIGVKVPEKILQTVSTYVTEFKDQSIATIEATTSNSTDIVTATLLTGDVSVTKPATIINNRFTVVFDNVQKDSTIRIDVKSSSGRTETVFKKLAKGNKKYVEVPKTPLDGVYSLHSVLTEKSLLTNILKYYTLEDLKIGKTQ
ncbi:hypothetical protein [Sporosarcina cascadiensis]|uniref:hypothetical protein n=1 Tax=Sporosarcina cascadiensis TaxID=2660747 RepID=UPI00129A75EA|nr:hypothetical protein [Sporosarcina cascadiensis]